MKSEEQCHFVKQAHNSSLTGQKCRFRFIIFLKIHFHVKLQLKMVEHFQRFTVFKVMPSLLSNVNWVSTYVKMNFRIVPKPGSERQRSQRTSAKTRGCLLSMVTQDLSGNRGDTEDDSATQPLSSAPSEQSIGVNNKIFPFWKYPKRKNIIVISLYLLDLKNIIQILMKWNCRHSKPQWNISAAEESHPHDSKKLCCLPSVCCGLGVKLLCSPCVPAPGLPHTVLLGRFGRGKK